jgi:hypothetical protein
MSAPATQRWSAAATCRRSQRHGKALALVTRDRVIAAPLARAVAVEAGVGGASRCLGELSARKDKLIAPIEETERCPLRKRRSRDAKGLKT